MDSKLFAVMILLSGLSWLGMKLSGEPSCMECGGKGYDNHGENCSQKGRW